MLVTVEMARRPVEHHAPHERSRQHHLELLICPPPSRKVLEKQYHLLEIESLELLAPLYKVERSKHVRGDDQREQINR